MNLKQPTAVFIYDILVIPLSWFLAYLLRYNFEVPSLQLLQASYIFGVLFPIQMVFYFYFGLYRGIWRFASIPDLIRIVKAVVLAAIFAMILLYAFTSPHKFLRSVFILYSLLDISFLGGARLLYRCLKERTNLKVTHKRVLIVVLVMPGRV